MRTFVVNLEQSTDRKKFVQQQLEGLNIAHEFFPAVDGRKFTEEQLKEVCNMDIAKDWPELFTRGMIGCSLSHYYIYKKMVAENIPYAFIMEDDVKLSVRVPILLNEIEKKLIDGTLSSKEPILLYYQSKEVVQFIKEEQVPLGNGVTACYPVDIWRPITTAAYIISLACAKKLIDFVFPVRCPADSWAVYHREGVIGGLRCVLPVPVESGFFKSDIGYEQNRFFNRIIKKLEAKNIFPVKQVLHWRRKKLAKKQNQFEFVKMPMNWQKKELA